MARSRNLKRSSDTARRRQAATEEKEKIALEIAIVEAELERKRIRDAIQRISDEMRDSSLHTERQESINGTSKANNTKPKKQLGAFLQAGILEKQHSTLSMHAFDGTETTATSETTSGSQSWSSGTAADYNMVKVITVQPQSPSSSDTFDECTVDEETIYEESTVLDEKSCYYYEEKTIADDKSCYEEYTLPDDKSFASYDEQTVEEVVEDGNDDESEAAASFFEEITVDDEDYDEDDEVESLQEENQFLRTALLPVHEGDEEEDDDDDEDDEAEESKASSSASKPTMPKKTQSVDPMDEETRRSIFKEAASLGRLTRLDEYTVEAVAVEPAIKPEDIPWHSMGLLNLSTHSLHREILSEVVEKGARTKLPERVVCNGLDLDEEEDEMSPEQVFLQQDEEENARLQSSSVKNLTAMFESGKNILSESSHSSISSSASLDLLLSSESQHRERKPSPRSASLQFCDVSQVQLPVPVLPSFKFSPQEGEPMITGKDLAKQVAVAAWDRQIRKKRGVKVTWECTCRYCATASPQQTYAYQQLSVKSSS